MNLNKVFLIGRLTADPQLRTTPGGQSVVTIAIATNRTWMDKNGKRQDETQFHNVVVWGKQAEVVSQFLKKGSMAFVEGRLQTRSWQDAKGETRRTTEIVSERVQLGPRAMGAGGFGGGSGGAEQFRGAAPARPSLLDEEPKEAIPDIQVDSEEIRPEEIPF